MASAEQTLHRYELLERIAAGGMAEVFLAKASGAHGFEKVLAIKRILPGLAADEEFTARFIEEAKIAVGLSHANIVQVFDFGRFGGSLYIAMEYVDGADLATLLKAADRRAMLVPVPTGLYVATEIAKALDYAHRKPDARGRSGIVHRDVSPSNVLLSYEGEVKLADFGIATAAAAAATERRRIMGKWRYMSPEQTEAQPLTPQSDIFSAGALFYELLTGRRLFGGDEIPEIVRNVRELAIPPPSSVRADLPPDFDRILLRALERDPARRYPAMKEMMAELYELGFSRTIRASALDAAEFVEKLVPHRRPPAAAAGPRPLDDILRSELGLEGSAGARVTALPATVDRATSPPVTLVRRAAGSDGLSVWDIERAPTVSAPRNLRSVFGLGAALALVGLLGAGASVLARRVGHDAPQLARPGAAAPAPAGLTLDVSSQPPGAGVQVDGALRLARTPGRIAGLAPGRHRVLLSREGYQSVEDDIDIASNMVLDRELRPLQGRLQLHIEPAGAEVWLDGTLVGTSPLAVPTSPGRHTVRAQKKGFAASSRSVEVPPGGTSVELRLETERRWGTLDVFSEPWGEIYVDGHDTGKQTPQRGLRLPAGHHRLRLHNPVLNASRELEVEVSPDERKLIRETLAR
jgi:tRNA A-37 threonylcarbamoyl transferase component Bud32